MKTILATGIATVFFPSVTFSGYLLSELGTGSTWGELVWFFKVVGVVALVSGIGTYILRDSINTRFVLW